MNVHRMVALLGVCLMLTLSFGACSDTCRRACEKACSEKTPANKLYQHLKKKFGSKIDGLGQKHCIRACEGELEKDSIDDGQCRQYLGR